MSTVFASLSLGIVIVTFPSSPSDISGFAGACVSFDLTLASFEVFSPSFAIATTLESFLILSAGILIRPESLFTLTPSTAGSIFHSPVVGSFFATTF